MPYIDKQYAEELLKKSQAHANGGPFRAADGTGQEVKKSQVCFHDAPLRDVDGVGQEAGSAR